MFKRFIALSLLACVHSFAEGGELNLDLLQNESHCKSVSVNIFGNASHPGGNPYRLLNERNDGIGMTCYLNKEKTRFLFGNALTNSQFGLSIAGGIGQGITLVEVSPIRFDVGISVTALSYEKRNGKMLYGVMPFPYAKLIVDLPGNMGYVGITQTYLSGNVRGIRLRNAEISISLMKSF